MSESKPTRVILLESIGAVISHALSLSRNCTVPSTERAIAENERNKIRARQREGIEAAKKKNVRFGRPPRPLPNNWREVLAEVRCGNKKPVEAMRELGISRSCYYRLINRI